jgi:hypothetical protein
MPDKIHVPSCIAPFCRLSESFLLIVGAILALLGALGRAVFGRRHYW